MTNALFDGPRQITNKDDRAGFDCGEPELNYYLQHMAFPNDRAGASTCYVVTLPEGRIVGYYCVAAASILRANAPDRISKAMPETIPVVLLARLGVDLSAQGRHIGSGLLRDAILRTVNAAKIIGARALLVHALHEKAKQFYVHFGFVESPTDPLHLMLLMKDARQFIQD